jgi:molybdenum cofactor cytidylyltransferase
VPVQCEAGATGIVLAGGAASRFGADKLAATLEGRALLRHAIEAVEAACDELVVVVGQGPGPDIGAGAVPRRVIHDPEAFPGPRAALLAGIEAASCSLALVVGGDMPWLQPAFLRLLLESLRRSDRDAVAPVLDGRLQPLPCALRVPAARAARPGPAGSLHALLGALGVAPLAEATWRAVDPAGQSLRDLDRPEQLAGPVHLPRRT